MNPPPDVSERSPAVADRSLCRWSGTPVFDETQRLLQSEGVPSQRLSDVACVDGVNSSEDQVSVVDVTDKSNVEVLGRVEYPQSDYPHLGWFTEDQAYFLVGDEGDEQSHGMNTRTIVLDLNDLDDPKVHFERVADTPSIDHNLYVKDGLVHQSNYTSGLRVLDAAGIPGGSLHEVAWFDTFPEHDDATFYGTWSNYPYFESGTIAVSGIDEGLFLLRLTPDEQVERQGRPDTIPPDHARGRRPAG